MKKAWDTDQGNVLIAPVIVLAVFFVAALVFGIWAFGGRQDYKNNVDAKINTAVDSNTKAVQATDAKQYAEAAKNPLKTYIGPDAYGSIKVTYPKTWSAYVDTSSSNSGTPLDAYFHADYVPGLQSLQTYNLRVQVNTQSYDTVLQTYSTQITQGALKATPYSLPKVPSVAGMRLDGTITQSGAQTINGSLIVLPLRANTLEIWTESNDYLADFNTYILPNLTFSP